MWLLECPVTSKDRRSALTVFKACEFTRPTGDAGIPPQPKTQVKTPVFLVRHEPPYFGWWSSLTTLCTRVRSQRYKHSISLFRSVSAARSKLTVRSLGASILLHCCLVGLLIYLPRVFPAKTPSLVSVYPQAITIFYTVPLPDSARALPRITPSGAAGRPEAGSIPGRLPALGSSARQGELTVISKPLHPDNVHLTIIQPSIPPDLRIPREMKLPDVILGNLPDAPRPPAKFSLSDMPKPTQANQNIAEGAAPVLETPSPEVPRLNYVEPVVPRPRLPIFVGPLKPPTRRLGNGGGEALGNERATSGNASDLVIVGVDPSGPVAQLGLPPGNLWGEFSVAPIPPGPGSPGGGPNGVGGAGRGESASGGEGSLGVGLKGSGGGGGDSESPLGPISIKGTQPITEGPETLPANLAANLVYPVLSAVVLKLRKNPLIVSAGPIGGGGLDVYGALDCSKVYTIFLPMPGANWTMQYCQRSSATTQAQAALRSRVVHLQPGLVPPDPDSESRFDFQRLHVPQEKAHKMILLKGTLRDDGTVDDLHVYQGVTAEMDQAAALAFSRWKFKPAMRENKAVSIEILVGIPVEIGSVQHAQ
jgi:Gram-negative bacterial TonB protein C-terminal